VVEVQRSRRPNPYTFIHSYRDFRVIEKKKRQPNVFTAEDLYRLEEMASKKKSIHSLGDES
jgi:hypothetical protein